MVINGSISNGEPTNEAHRSAGVTIGPINVAGVKCESRDRNLGALIEGIGGSEDWRCE